MIDDPKQDEDPRRDDVVAPGTGSNTGAQKDQGAEKVVKPVATPEQQIEDDREEKRRKAG
jgi:hypothetical protein